MNILNKKIDFSFLLKLSFWVDVLLVVYLVTISVEIISNTVNPLLQNVSYLGFIFLSLLETKFRIKFKPFQLQYGIFMAIAALSFIWSINGDNSLIILRYFIKMFVFCFFAVNYLNTNKDNERFLFLIYLSIIICAAYVLINSTPEDWLYQRIGKAYGIDTVRLSFRMAVASFIGFYLFDKNKNVIHLLICIVLIALAFLMGKRTSLIFFIIAMLFYLFSKTKNVSERLKIIGISSIMVIVCLICIFTVPVFYETIGVRFEEFVGTMFLGDSTDSSTLQRIELMNYALDLFFENPLIGNGLNATRSYLETINYSHVTYAHNNFLEIMSGLGVLGLVSYYSIYALPFIKYSKTKKTKNNIFLVALIAILFGMFICDFVQVSYESYFELVLLAFLSNAIIDGINKQEVSQEENN